jgi:hypothetical protein
MKLFLILFLTLALLSNLRFSKDSLKYLGVFYINWAEAILQTRMWLQDVMGQSNDPKNWTKLTGFLDYLFNPAVNPRTIGVEYQSQSNQDLYRGVSIRYTPHDGTSNLITNDALATCTAVSQRRDTVGSYNTTLYAEAKFTIQEAYVLQNKENGFGLQQRLNMEIQNAMRKVRESIDSQLFAKAATVMGANPAAPTGAGSYFPLTLLSSSTGQVDGRFWDYFKNHQEDNHSTGPLSVIGLGNMRGYANRLATGGLASTGIDYKEVLAQFGMLFFKDSATTSALGNANRVLACYPGAAQFYQYNLFRGEYKVNLETLIKDTMQDPIYPITYDFSLKYDDGCTGGNGQLGAWTGRIFTYFDLFYVDEKAYGDTYSELNDFNGILGYLIKAA